MIKIDFCLNKIWSGRKKAVILHSQFGNGAPRRKKRGMRTGPESAENNDKNATERDKQKAQEKVRTKEQRFPSVRKDKGEQTDSQVKSPRHTNSKVENRKL